jgi:hypothetical protein
MVRFSDDNRDLHLGETLAEIKHLCSMSENDRAMLRFFNEEVIPEIAYTDNDINQGKGGPKRNFVEGKWKKYDLPKLRIRLGVSPNLIPSLQLILGEQRGNLEAVIEYTNRYGPMFEYAQTYGENYDLVLKLASDFPKTVKLYAEKNRLEQEISSR